MKDLHAKFGKVRGGEVASYIPELTKQDPELFGITIATVDGRVISVGDTDAPFTIQSIAKPFIYGLALQDNGRNAMLEKVGLEPTGLPFNSILAVDIRSSKLQNPLVNAGAIATASLIRGNSSEQKYARVEKMFSGYFGETAAVDEPVYKPRWRPMRRTWRSPTSSSMKVCFTTIPAMLWIAIRARAAST